MRRLVCVAGVLAAMLVAVFNVHAAETPAVTIHAQFFSAERATHYTAILTNEPGDELPTFLWKLDHVQIDANGKVDPTCNKTEEKSQRDFIWHHADDQGCDHAKEGTHGHQGRITLLVHMKNWDCKTTYDGSTGNPPDGPTALCEALGPIDAAKGPCDDARAKVAQIEAELAAMKESLDKLYSDAWKAYYARDAAEWEYWLAADDEEAKAASDAWHASYADEKRISKAYNEALSRYLKLRTARRQARDALAACEKSSKRLTAGRTPAARCTTAVMTAAKARGRVAGYAEVARRFQASRFVHAAGNLRSTATHLRAAAKKLPKARSRLLRDAKKADAAAAALLRGAKGLAVVNTKRAVAAKGSTTAQAALAKCLAGGR
jgi:hypothetical protein